MKGKVIESYIDDTKPITIYIGEKMLKLIEEYGYEELVLEAINEAMHIPFYILMTKYCDDYDYYEEEDIPVKVYVRERYANAFENTPKKVKARLMLAITARIQEIVVSELYATGKLCNENENFP
jgi:hypothetical protein